MTIKEPLLYSFQIDRPMGEDLYILGKNNPINIKQSFPIVDIKMNFKAKAEDLTQEISTDKIYY